MGGGSIVATLRWAPGCVRRIQRIQVPVGSAAAPAPVRVVVGELASFKQPKGVKVNFKKIMGWLGWVVAAALAVIEFLSKNPPPASP